VSGQELHEAEILHDLPHTPPIHLLSCLLLKETWCVADPEISTCRNLSLAPHRAGIFYLKTWAASSWESVALTYEEGAAHMRVTSFLVNPCPAACQLPLN